MKKIILAPLVLTLIFTACDKVTENLPEEEITVNDDAFTQSYFAEIDDLTYAGVHDEGGRLSHSDGRFDCATFTTGTNNMTIDFGDGCEGPRGRVRAGKVLIERTAPFWEKNAVLTTTFENFSIDGNIISGTRVMENLGTDENGFYTFRVTLVDGKIQFSDGTSLTRNSEFQRTWIRGANVLEDQLHVTGNASGINRKGISYTMDIIEPLVYKLLCKIEGIPMAVSGVKELSANGKTISADFGDGSCDNVVSLTYNDITRDIEINF